MKRVLAICAVSAFLLAACGDDESSGFTTRPDEDSSSSVCEDCDDSSSSSSVTPQSSSSKNGDAGTSAGMTSSSSSQDTTYNAEKNTLTDTRDGKVYRTVKIGDQVWMAENLNFETDSSYCYNDSAEYCAKYGRLYRWTAAMDACPSGWHLPDLAEWKTLLAAVGGDSIAGTKLKSTSGWNSDGNGTDDFGFTVLPAGGWRSKDFVGEVAAFWTSSWYEEYGDYVNGVKLYTDNTIVRQTYRSMYYAYSVRCVKGSATVPPSSSSSKPVETSSSSSKPVETSSCSGISSSSQFKRVLCNVDTDKNCFKDERDGQTYKTVTIGTQTWMAENLNLKTESSSCYNDFAENCAKYGRLYTWAAAMDSAGIWSTNGKGCGRHEEYGTVCSATYPVRGVCPEGWHLPTQAEWKALFTAVGDSSTVGKMLKSISGWNDSGNGTDSYAFSALPAGYWDGYYTYEGSAAFFWSSTEYNGYYAYYMYLGYYFDHAGLDDHRKDDRFSVRCIKD
jgi:uncharacterized protein (TIGR02145 family)